MTTFDSTIEYRDVAGFVGYKIDSDGNLWSCWRGPLLSDEWKKLKPCIHQKRTAARTYHCFRLWRNGKPHTKLAHRIVLEAFVGPRPAGHESRHIDGNPLNNARSNLCWGTHAENTADSRRLGRYATKLTEDQVREIRRRDSAGEDRRALAVEFNTTYSNIGSIMSRQSWKHLD